MRHADRLARNPRMKMPYDTLRRMPDEQRAAIRDSAEAFFASPEMSPEPRPIPAVPRTAQAQLL